MSALEGLIGSYLQEDVYSHTGHLLIAKGTLLTHRHIELLSSYHLLNPLRSSYSIEEEPKGLTNDQYLETKEYMKNVFQLASNYQLPPLDEMRSFFHPKIELSLQQHNIMPMIHHLRDSDANTYEHSVNVGLISAVIGKILGLSFEKQLLLGELGVFHDIGKSLIDPEVLHKKGKFTPEERKIMDQHTMLGYKLLRDSVGNHTAEVLNSALLHHEKMDGSGYPLRIRNQQIPWYIQIVSVADTYDAIVRKRSYKEKKTPFFAAGEMRIEAFNKKLNPHIVFPFFNYILRQYINSEVILSNGEVGKVVFVHQDAPHFPLVKVEERIVDLRKEQELEIIEVCS